jgi:hypothetical protein
MNSLIFNGVPFYERLRFVNTFIDFFGFRGVLKKIILKSAQELFGIDRVSVAIQDLDFDA